MALTADALLETRDAFNRVAVSYDASNAANPLLRAMRRCTIEHLTGVVAAGADILELGCGPGTDSQVLANAGFSVTAIDWSDAMVREAEARCSEVTTGGRLTVRQLGIHQLDQLPESAFDAAFSNFGPLNCVPDLADAACQIAARLRPGALLVASVIGRVCPWEMGVYVSRGDVRRAMRRFSRGFVGVPLAGGTVWTRYYTPGEFESIFRRAGFTRTYLRGMGVFTPPPYLEAFAARHRRLLSGLQWLDDRTGAWPLVRLAGDHFLMTLRKP